MSRHKKREYEQTDLLSGEVERVSEEVEREHIGPAVVSRTAPLFQVEKQDELINEMENNGYRHYETLFPPRTAEALLRFRRI